MITFTKAYATGDGKTFKTLEEAQHAELMSLLTSDAHEKSENQVENEKTIISAILENLPAVLNILSTTASSRPRGRKANGASRKRPTRVDPMANAERAGSQLQSEFKQTTE